ncbi:MAG: histidine kinase [Rikenellaceae bacterium]|nr:histidine kinase [Rikenellaceae bacterium]
MNISKIKTNTKIILMVSFILSLLVTIPNITRISSVYGTYIFNAVVTETVTRFIIFFFLSWYLFFHNSRLGSKISKEITKSIILAIAAYLVCVFIQSLLSLNLAKMSGFMIFQFLVVFTVSLLSCEVYKLYNRQTEIEQENEMLKIETLQSRCDALTNQINPHFFFNTLNTMSSLIRENLREKSLEYIDKLSVVFRYILQSEKKGLVTLEEELKFLESYRFLLEVRYENKFRIITNIKDIYYKYELPVLSFLPLIENAVKHNVISSSNPMDVNIFTEKDSLVISNRVVEKLETGEESGIGLKNLDNRFSLLTGKNIIIKRDNDNFNVILPLLKPFAIN